jgi:hypothetical protein
MAIQDQNTEEIGKVERAEPTVKVFTGASRGSINRVDRTPMKPQFIASEFKVEEEVEGRYTVFSKQIEGIGLILGYHTDYMDMSTFEMLMDSVGKFHKEHCKEGEKLALLSSYKNIDIGLNVGKALGIVREVKLLERCSPIIQMTRNLWGDILASTAAASLDVVESLQFKAKEEKTILLKARTLDDAIKLLRTEG